MHRLHTSRHPLIRAPANAAAVCKPGRECLSTSKVFYQAGESVVVGFSNIRSSDADVITIESIDGAVPCLHSRFTDGRSIGSTTERFSRDRQGMVTFDSAASPLPPGEYLIRLQSAPAPAVMASTHFVVMPRFDPVLCGGCHAAVVCMPFWAGSTLDGECSVCPTGYDSSKCTGDVCEECSGKLPAVHLPPFCTASRPRFVGSNSADGCS